MGFQLEVESDGFSLLELLLVLAIIGLFTVGVGFSLSDGLRANQLLSAERIAMEMVRVARSEAIMRQTSVRLMIKGAEGESEDCLRLMAIVCKDSDGRWYTVGKGRRLPVGVCYWPDRSKLSSDQPMRLKFPCLEPVAEGSGDLWYYLEFDHQGRLSLSGVHWVMGLVSEGDRAFKSEVITSGFSVFRLGGMSPLRKERDR